MAEGLGGLSTIGDLLSGGMSFVGEAEGISSGTLQGSLQIKQQTVEKEYLRQVYHFNQRIGIPFRIPDGGVEAGASCLTPVILIPPKSFSVGFLAFGGGGRVDWRLSLTGPSP
jgi:hypothetical protein